MMLGDFMTRNTLWDLKVLKGPITQKNALQVLIYWIMGIHSITPEYRQMEYIGFLIHG